MNTLRSTSSRREFGIAARAAIVAAIAIMACCFASPAAGQETAKQEDVGQEDAGQEVVDPEAAYLNPDLPTDQRIDDLIGRMTLEEKVSQLLDQAPAVERLGIPEYNWWNEALHGVARSGLATVFPQAIGLAATWDDTLIHEMATVISDEARAKHHEYVRKDKRLRYQGLTIFSPNINIFRDPRWGRGQETYGEDPHLTGTISDAFVRGLQGDDPDHLKTVATIKHYAVHSGPEPERHHFDAVADERDFRETYLPHFERGIRESRAESIMCAYNRVYGEAACSSELLLQDILREEWGFEGYVVTDCWALDDIYLRHKLVDTAVEAAAMSLQAGSDLECGSAVFPELVDAVERGLVTEEDVDRAVRRVMSARFRLGMFDPPERVPYAQIPYEVVDRPEHRELAQEVARKSMVLLKNDGVLPLAKDLGTIAVIGPNADQWLMLLGNYNGVPGTLTTPLDGIREAVDPSTNVLYAQGAEPADGFPLFNVVSAERLAGPDGEEDLKVEYFDSREIEGEAVYEETAPVLDANWHDRAPREDLDDDDFSARWTGILQPDRTGTYRLGVIATMKFELYVEDSLALRSRYNYMDELGDPRLQETEPLHLEAGETYRLRLDAHEGYGDAQVQLLWTTPERDLMTEAVTAADQADAVVLFLGLTPAMEGEEMDVEIEGFRGGDRTRLDLPDSQQRLLQRVVEVGKPTVLVLLNGSALAVNWADENVPAILEAWYPGQAAGNAIADVLFGDYNPAGRLPVTFYRSVDDLPPFEDYDMDGRTYRFFDGEVLYPFGHGLSYTSFEYDDLRVRTSSNGRIAVRASVTNTGSQAGDEVVQLYVQYPESEVERPIRELKAFDRINLQPGETKVVRMELDPVDLAYWNPNEDRWVVEEKPVRVQIGASSQDIRLEETVDVIE